MCRLSSLDPWIQRKHPTFKGRPGGDLLSYMESVWAIYLICCLTCLSFHVVQLKRTCVTCCYLADIMVSEDGLLLIATFISSHISVTVLLYLHLIPSLLTERATSGSLQSEDWGLNMEICDIINETDEG